MRDDDDDDDECGAVGGMSGRGKRNARRKPAPVPHCPPQIPYDLTLAWTRAEAVGSRCLTAVSMTALQYVLKHTQKDPVVTSHKLAVDMKVKATREQVIGYTCVNPVDIKLYYFFQDATFSCKSRIFIAVAETFNCLGIEFKKLNSMVWVCERTLPPERPPLVGEVIANFCG
jgi:hypothetical protein